MDDPITLEQFEKIGMNCKGKYVAKSLQYRVQLNINDNYNPEKSMSTHEFTPFVHISEFEIGHAMKSLITASKKMLKLIKLETYLEMTRNCTAIRMHFT